MKPRGFTLIELLIVVAIIGILAAVAIPNFMAAQTRAKVSRVKADLQAIKTALLEYEIDHEEIPGTRGPNPKRIVDCATRWNLTCLTTPIAYLSNPVFEEPFNKQQGGSPYPNYYQYWCSKRPERWKGDFMPDEFIASFLPNQIDNRPPREPQNPSIRAEKWILCSVGPSGTWASIWWTAAPFVSYDPTNGLMSVGIIWGSDISFQQN